MSQTLVRPHEQAGGSVSLPVSWYFDPEILEIERQALFAAGPTYAGHRSLVQQNGDYFALGGQQVGKLLVQSDGRPRLLSNVCRHRQAELLRGSGQVKNIVCPVHNWAYDLSGRQIAAPHFEQNPCLDLERTELTEWNGFLFTGPRNIRHELAPLDGWTELATSDYVLERVDEEEHDLNWKVFLEVYLEDYHIGAVHPGFRAFVEPADIRGALRSVGGERFYCEEVNVRWPMPMAGSPVFAKYQKVLIDVLAGRRPSFAAIWMCLFSGQLIEWYPFSVIVTTYLPLSPTRTRLRSEYYFDHEIAETRRDYIEAGLAVLDEVTGEDQAAAEKLQNGRVALHAAGENRQGPYQMPMEQGLRRFHDCLREIVQNA
ncbi:MAG TPA: aromatic ring-hydroxylating dioxygenase subunit alpha [Lacipirellulaceae bacterium]|nr:aromatic ring-hydroxylating dioxygenase subunit alpha [Lacipirellulaceae bacterium]